MDEDTKTQRDVIAMVALHAMISNAAHWDGETDAAELAKHAYLVADEMIKRKEPDAK